MPSLIQSLATSLDPNPPHPGESGAEGRYRRASQSALSALGLLLFLGFFLLVASSWSSDSRASLFQAAAPGVFVAGASTIVGALVGFLFGIPRTLQGDVVEISHSEAGAADAKPKVGYRANTNLEQISDWLTKILVGVGLTQLSHLPEALQDLAGFLGPGLGGKPTSVIVAGSAVVYFSTSGFLLAYLWTRLHLPSALRYADLDAIGALEEKVSLLEEQRQADAVALSVVEQQLNGDSDSQLPTQEVLTRAITAASPPTRITVFYRAHDFRRDHWRTDREAIERVIPVFRALIAADPEQKYHRNHAQLAYALKDKVEPDYVQALNELETAIRIRDKEGQKGFGLYEANRAFCRIKLFDQLQKTIPADELRRLIEQDIKIAQTSKLGRQMLETAEFQPWLKPPP